MGDWELWRSEVCDAQASTSGSRRLSSPPFLSFSLGVCIVALASLDPRRSFVFCGFPCLLMIMAGAVTAVVYSLLSCFLCLASLVALPCAMYPTSMCIIFAAWLFSFASCAVLWCHLFRCRLCGVFLAPYTTHELLTTSYCCVVAGFENIPMAILREQV